MTKKGHRLRLTYKFGNDFNSQHPQYLAVDIFAPMVLKRLKEVNPLNPRHAGGCLNTHPHEVFFVNNLKTATRSAAVFVTPYHTSFPHML